MARSMLGALMGEIWAGAEFLEGLVTPAGSGLPNGDGSGVLLIPGLWGGDESLFIIQRDLLRLGYDARSWGLGINNRCGEETIADLVDVARRHRKRHQRPLAVIGHSRGGFMARTLVRRAPEIADLVITLGTPVGARTLDGQSIAVQAMLQISRALFARKPGCLSERCDCEYVKLVDAPMPASVAAYSLWSRDDGVVRAADCARPGEPNVEVPGTHIGMVANREVLKTVAEILARHRSSTAGATDGNLR
jgi:triacylglycerol lipase